MRFTKTIMYVRQKQSPKLLYIAIHRRQAITNTMDETKLHIVLVDDDRFQVTALKKLIDDTGLANEVLHFENGQEAMAYINELTQAGSTLPDVIFLDINMPVMNAWKFLDAYKRVKRQLYKPVAVYVLTSSTDGLDMGKSRHYETVKGYIVKPVTREKVYEILKAATEL
jgi:CheY-like chemotaxis protein